MQKIPAIFCWSGGKDCSYALYKVQEAGIYEVKYLLTTCSRQYGRVSIHGIRQELIMAQSQALNIPMLFAFVDTPDNTGYEQSMEAVLPPLKNEGIHHILFGDIFLIDLRAYREDQMKKLGFESVFPLWQQDTKLLATTMIEAGFKNRICCINEAYIDEEWAGKEFDQFFIDALPPNVDPCGENGEFHSFCYQSPLFTKPIYIKNGETRYVPLAIKTTGEEQHEKVTKIQGFWFRDLVLA